MELNRNYSWAAYMYNIEANNLYSSVLVLKSADNNFIYLDPMTANKHPASTLPLTMKSKHNYWKKYYSVTNCPVPEGILLPPHGRDLDFQLHWARATSRKSDFVVANLHSCTILWHNPGCALRVCHALTAVQWFSMMVVERLVGLSMVSLMFSLLLRVEL